MGSVIEFEVRYCETDQMQVANHARYLDWFSEGRVAWLKDRGFFYSDWEKNGLALPVVEVFCNYRKSARFQELLRLETWLGKLNPRGIEFEYSLSHDGKLLATARTKHVFLKNFRPVRLEESIYQILKGEV